MEQFLINFVREVIEGKLSNKTYLSKDEAIKKYLVLKEKKATFITLTLDGNLRGCIGSLIAHRDFYDDLVNNSLSAAFNDPRFKPINAEEFKKVKIEISILTTPEIVEYKDINDLKSKINSNNGIILKKGFNQSTFLPQVWEQLPEFELFFNHLCQKARLGRECLLDKPEIYKYSVDKIKE